MNYKGFAIAAAYLSAAVLAVFIVLSVAALVYTGFGLLVVGGLHLLGLMSFSWAAVFGAGMLIFVVAVLLDRFND